MPLFVILLIGGLLQGCSTSRYQQDVDSTPAYSDAIQTLAEPVAKREPLSLRGNADSYEVWGQTYQVEKYIQEYKSKGIASWYGQKFHGHETSNGERFDVYKFTAAHKSLPLPSYVRVTNIHNNKSIVVRVNDRGPFHDDRLIDLSYAAAVRLGFAKTGTAQVEVELIAPPLTQGDYQHLQVGAFQTETSAHKMKLNLASIIPEPIYIQKDVKQGNILHKVRIGPLSPDRLDGIQSTLRQQNYPTGLILP